MLRGDEGAVERDARPRLSWVAFLEESTEETRWRFGTEDASGLHLSGVR